MSVLHLPPKTRKLIKNYLELKIGPHKLQCPYFQNIRKKRKRPVFAGKGRPEEIEKETLKLFKKKKKLLAKLSPETIRLYMVMCALGIDCSGLVVNVLDSFLQEKGLEILWRKLRYPSFNPIRLAAYKLRPRSNLSATILTHPSNTFCLNELNKTRPGDLLKVGNHHVAVISEVEVNKKNEVIRISYIHSTSDYLEQHGIRKGNILIVDRNKPLEKQKWDEEHQGRNWMLEDYLTAPKNRRGLRRLRILI